MGGGPVSSSMQPEYGAPVSKNAYMPKDSAPVSKNFLEAERAAKAASRAPKSQTLKVLQRPW